MEMRLLVRGDRACFKRPDFVHDLISYDVLTPIAARGIVQAVHRDPTLSWTIDEIRVLRPIRFTWMALAEVEAGDPGGPLPARIAGPADRRIACVLSDVAYLIVAHAETQPGGGGAPRGLLRPAYLGYRGFPAEIDALDDHAPPPPGAYDGSGAIDLGWMLYDAGREAQGGMRLYRPTMVDGTIDLRRPDSLIVAG